MSPDAGVAAPISVNDIQLPATEFVNAGTSAFLAQAFRVGDVRSVRMSFTAAWGVLDENVLLRLHVKVGLYDVETETGTSLDEDNKLGELECQLVGEYMFDGDPQILAQPEVLRAFVEQCGLHDLFPYIRESIASMSTRLGFGGVNLRTLDRTFLAHAMITAD